MFTSTTDSSSTLQTLSGDLQLLIPAWRFSSAGYVSPWEAIVQGSASNSAIEFQIFRPAQKAGEYGLVYGNVFNAANGGGDTSRTITVAFTCIIQSAIRIPVKPGDIVGIRLKNGAGASFGLQYSNTSTPGTGVDVYYWQGMASNSSCNFSTCDPFVGVLRGIIPLVSWKFCELKKFLNLFHCTSL